MTTREAVIAKTRGRARHGYEYHPVELYEMRPEMFRSRGHSMGWVCDRAYELREKLEAMGISPRQICLSGLDNPLMSDDARACMISSMRRER